MQTTSALYKQILADPRHVKEWRAQIGEATFDKTNLVSIRRSSALYGKQLIGGACSGSLELVLWNVASNDVPEMARIELFARLVSDSGTSEWLPMGTYWINRRKDDQEDDTLTLQCVDGMMFGEQDFYPTGSTITDWTSKTMREVAQICATKMGIALEDETQFQNAAPYVLTAPPIGYTVRQVLQGIAAAHSGNIIVTADNKLRLVPFVPTNSGADLGQHAASLEAGKQYEAFGNVVFTFDSADGEERIVRYPAIEATGATMEAPLLAVTDGNYATTIAQNVLTALGSYRYAPYKAKDALLDPAMELGDGLTVDDLYSVIAEADEICDELYSATIGAESFEEIKNEFIFQPSIEKTVERKIAQSSASLKINIDAIIAQVTDGQGNYTALTLRSDGLHVGNAQGTVTIGSGSIHIPNGVISFGDGTLDGALQAAYDHTGGGDPNPSYIHSTYISKTKVISPHVYGGDLYATGQGNAAGTNPAFYMSDGVTGSGASTEPNEPKGWLCYDKNGAGTSQEAENRVFLHSEPGVALKLDAGGDMSLEADDSIYFLSYLKLRKGVNYGTAVQRDAITPENGQIFFVVE